LENAQIRDGVLGISGDQTEDALKQVQTVLVKRRRVFDRERLREVVETQIDAATIQEAQAHLADLLPDQRAPWLQNVEFHETGSPTAFLLPRLQVRANEPKRWFLEKQERSDGRWRTYTDRLSFFEACGILSTLEQHAPHCAEAKSHAEIISAVQQGFDALKSDGYHPSTIWIPPQERFGYALFRCPEWQYPARRRTEPCHLGVWQDCDVYEFEYKDPSSVLVCDLRACLTKNEATDAGQVSLDVSERDPEAAHRMLTAADEENADSNIADPSEVRVDVVANVEPYVGLRDLTAARRVDIDPERLGYAMTSTGKVYHRPGCSLIGESEVSCSLGPFLESDKKPRRPCNQCKPQDWDDAPLVKEGEITVTELD
jgi:hypothetical protein